MVFTYLANVRGISETSRHETVPLTGNETFPSTGNIPLNRKHSP